VRGFHAEKTVTMLRHEFLESRDDIVQLLWIG